MPLDKNTILDEIFNNDPLGILNIKPKQSSVKTADDRFADSFREIVDFVRQNNREPEPGMNNITESQLYYRLKNIREDYGKIESVRHLDVFGLLPITGVSEPPSEYNAPKSKKKEIESIDDIFSDDSFSILDEDDAGLFDFKHTPKDFNRAEADFIAKRKPCKDFDQYETKFKTVQNDLSKGKRKLIDFKQSILQPDNYYVHNGILFYLESINITQKEHYKDDGTRVREDGRTRCIFENGTESNMLKRSVEKILYENGKVVTRNSDEVQAEIESRLSGITEEDKDTGFIYVLRSLSKDPSITEINNLYKIGYSSTPVVDRIKNAEKEPTYLMAPVNVIGEWKCYNLNPQKLEQLLHNFFGSACLNIDVFDEKGNRHSPREWFIAPLHIIEKAIEMVVSGEIVGHKYDKERQIIIN